MPVVAPVGTSAVTCVSELIVKVVAATRLNVTFVVCRSPVPVITTGVPTGPLVGLKLARVGVTWNMLLLVSVVAPVCTVTNPVRAPAGTVAVINVVPERVIAVACVPPNFTTDELLKPWPRMPIMAPSLPDVLTNEQKAPFPISKL